MTVQRQPRPSPQRAVPAEPKRRVMYVPTGETSTDFDAPLSTSFLASLSSVRARAVPAPVESAVAGHSRRDLLAIAELGRYYLFSGNPKIAQVLFEGLAAIDPNEAYFALALGLTYDRLELKTEADAAYRRASELDPKAAHPEINRAELMLENGDLARARALLAAGLAKAKVLGDLLLEQKARALLDHVQGALRGRK